MPLPRSARTRGLALLSLGAVSRGLAQEEYAPGPLRQKLFGSPLLNDRHPAARYRGAFSAHARTWDEAADLRSGGRLPQLT